MWWSVVEDRDVLRRCRLELLPQFSVCLCDPGRGSLLALSVVLVGGLVWRDEGDSETEREIERD